MAKIRIGITGNMRSGKDTVAELIEHHIVSSHSTPQTIRTIGFVDGIRELIQLFIPHEFDKGKPREALQQIGQLMRSFDEDVWVNRTMNRIAEFPESDSIIVKDVRQPNEVQALRDRGFTIVKVTSPERTRIARAIENNDQFNPKQLLHETELAIDDIIPDYVIQNNGSLQDLTHTTRNFLYQVYSK